MCGKFFFSALPLWEPDASLTLPLSCQCSSECRSRRELSRSCRRDLWNLSLSSDPVGSLKHWQSSPPQKTWSSDKGPAESKKVRKKQEGYDKSWTIIQREGKGVRVMQHHVTSGPSDVFLYLSWSCFLFINMQASSGMGLKYFPTGGLTPLGMKYPPTTKSSWVMRPLPGRTGKSLGGDTQRLLLNSPKHSSSAKVGVQNNWGKKTTILQSVP